MDAILPILLFLIKKDDLINNIKVALNFVKFDTFHLSGLLSLIWHEIEPMLLIVVS